jgi:hypothetical protein
MVLSCRLLVFGAGGSLRLGEERCELRSPRASGMF